MSLDDRLAAEGQKSAQELQAGTLSFEKKLIAAEAAAKEEGGRLTNEINEQLAKVDRLVELKNKITTAYEESGASLNTLKATQKDLPGQLSESRQRFLAQKAEFYIEKYKTGLIQLFGTDDISELVNNKEFITAVEEDETDPNEDAINSKLQSDGQELKSSVGVIADLKKELREMSGDQFTFRAGQRKADFERLDQLITQEELKLEQLRLQTLEGRERYVESRREELRDDVANSINNNNQVVTESIYNDSQIAPELNAQLIVEIAAEEKARNSNHKVFEQVDNLLQFKEELEKQEAAKQELRDVGENLGRAKNKIIENSAVLKDVYRLDTQSTGRSHLNHLSIIDGELINEVVQSIQQVTQGETVLSKLNSSYPDFAAILATVKNIEAVLNDLATQSEGFDELTTEDQNLIIDSAKANIKKQVSYTSVTSLFEGTGSIPPLALEAIGGQSGNGQMRLSEARSGYNLITRSLEVVERDKESALKVAREKMAPQIEFEWKTIEHRKDSDGMNAVDQIKVIEKLRNKAIDDTATLIEIKGLMGDEDHDVVIRPETRQHRGYISYDDPKYQQLSQLQVPYNDLMSSLTESLQDEVRGDYDIDLNAKAERIQQELGQLAKPGFFSKSALKANYDKKVATMTQNIQTLQQMTALQPKLREAKQSSERFHTLMSRIQGVMKAHPSVDNRYYGPTRDIWGSDNELTLEELLSRLKADIKDKSQLAGSDEIVNAAKAYQERGARIAGLQKSIRGY